MHLRKLILLALAALACAAAIATSGASVKPGSLGSDCGVFPRPANDVPADAASLDDQRAWNQDISNAPVDPRSDQIIDSINSNGGDMLHPDFGSPRQYGIPYKVVGKGAKRVKVHFTAYGDESDHGKYRIPLNAPIEGGSSSDGDRHVIVYDKARCLLYELGRGFPRKSQHRWDATVGVIWDLTSAGLRPDGYTSADAAGLPIFPGLVRYDEVAAGHVDHAIRVTFDTTRDGWIHPASHCAGSSQSADAPPMGMRFRLKSGYDISGITGQARVIAEAMKQQYGFFNADNGSNWYFQGSSDPRWDDDSLNQLKEIPGSAFEVVRSQADFHAC
ncbi:MAG: hypothetical protein QOI10_2814 [Solirubrobacterales bacterium]|jgi:hypothetical protein|nr:hypothetical protein [Solirubrobacterales bacterium]